MRSNKHHLKFYPPKKGNELNNLVLVYNSKYPFQDGFTKV